MSVYIKGMEMPKNCGQCLFKRISPTGDSMVCELTLDTVPWDWRTIDCPLIPVHDHGDLIDRDALPIQNPIRSMMIFGGEIVIAKSAIDDAPTIIAADGKDGAE